jgi:PPK2 family polyphosphate:nucleotide phosphotransferase
MDTAGKDGVIRHVTTGLNPLGREVHSFRPPSEEELHHDFLWRANRLLPARGRIGVFNRSYYEEVLVVRVHPEQLAGEGLSAAPDEDFWRGRYRAMVEMERHLDASCTRVVKFFLHLSADEQRKRLLARIDEPDKNWKFNLTDIAERALWPDYMRAYADCLSATSTDRAPWYVVPSDDKRSQRLIVAAILRSAMEAMKLRYPKVGKRRREELEAIRRALEKQSPRGKRARPG